MTAGGAYFFRFLRLALMMGLGYYGVYRLAFWLFPAIDRWTIDVTVERTVLAFHLSALALVGLLMVVVHLIAQYAKIATVRERRRSMLLAVLRSVRLVLAHPLQSVGLYGTMLATLGILQVTYFWLAPETTGASPLSLVFAFALGQVYLIFRWAIRIARYGAEIEQFDRWTGHPTGRGATDVG